MSKSQAGKILLGLDDAGHGRRVLYLLFGSVVAVRRAREFATRNRIYMPGIVLLENCCVAVSTPDPALEPGAFQNLQSGFSLTLVYWNRLCMRKARPMSPAMRSLPVMNAIWPFSLPLSMSR